MEPSAHFERKQALFEEALDLPKEARKAFLESACADDEALREEVEALLRAWEKGALPANPFLVRMTDGPVSGTSGLRIGAVLADRYRITEELGRGGMGMVYLAQNIDPGLSALRRVALKQALPAFRHVFDREIKILSAFSHPHVPKVLELLRVGEDRILVMEYIEGKNLKDLLKERRASLRPDTILNWADTLLSTLHALHTFNPHKVEARADPESIPETAVQKPGKKRFKKRPAAGPVVSVDPDPAASPRPVLHQDIKPANVMLSDTGNLYLMDFGLARSGVLDLTTLHDIKGGTRAYASPEQFDGSALVTIQSDIYGLGATLFHLLTGLPPVAAPDREEARLRGRADPVAQDLLSWQRSGRARRLRRDVSAWLLKAMALDPAHRWASAEAMQTALRELRERDNKRYSVSMLMLVGILGLLVAFSGYREYRQYRQWATASATSILPESHSSSAINPEQMETNTVEEDTVSFIASGVVPEKQVDPLPTQEDTGVRKTPESTPSASGVAEIKPLVTNVTASFSFADGRTSGLIYINDERISQRIGVPLVSGAHRIHARRAGQVLESVEVSFVLHGTPEVQRFAAPGGEAVVHLEPDIEDVKIKLHMRP